MKRNRKKRLRRPAALLLILALLLPLLPQALAEGQSGEDFPNTWENTGDQAADIVGVALTQVGYQEYPDDHTKYNIWYYGSDTELAWCSIFISWCADQAGVETWVSCKNNRAKGFSVDNMEDNPFGGTAWAWGSVEPQPGDILYTAPVGQRISTHTALVYGVEDGLVYTVEGNTKDADGTGAVVLQSYNRSDGSQLEENDRILFVVRPDYHSYTCTDVQQPTCTEPGQNTWTCTRCGAQKVTAGAEATGHRWDGGTLITPATGTAEGAVRYTCTVCGQTRVAALAAGSRFADVQDQTAWYYTAVNWAAGQGITTGTGSLTFSPEQACTRSQAVAMLWHALGEPSAASTDFSFEDIPLDSSWYAAAAWAVSKGISAGTSEISFAPDAVLTRAQTVTLLWRAAGAPETAADGPGFTDVSPDAWYAQAVAWAVDRGIAAGISDTVFGAEEPVTRAQLVTMLWRQADSP